MRSAAYKVKTAHTSSFSHPASTLCPFKTLPVPVRVGMTPQMFFKHNSAENKPKPVKF